MAFHDVRFPDRLSVGSSGGPQRRTEIVSLANGFEQRNTNWAESRRRYDAGVGLSSLDDLAEVVAFFEARRGQLHAFRWKDPMDHKSCQPGEDIAPTDQPIGTGDGTETAFQLVKVYPAVVNAWTRVVSKPVANSVRVAVDGEEKVYAADFIVNHASGLVTFTAAPGAGATITAGYEFDVPVRFDIDQIAVNIAAFEAGDIPTIPLIEVRP